LDSALLQLELRQQDVQRLAARNACLESELKREERAHTNALKDNIMLKKQLAEMHPKRRGDGPRPAISDNALS